jgi:hypothetical protein
MLKGRLGHWQLKGGDAQHAGGLEVKFDGRSRGRLRSGSAATALILASAPSTVTASYTSEATDAAVHANIVAAGYGR